MSGKTRTCDNCSNTMATHKYGEYLCNYHFYERWSEVYGYE